MPRFVDVAGLDLSNPWVIGARGFIRLPQESDLFGDTQIGRQLAQHRRRRVQVQLTPPAQKIRRIKIPQHQGAIRDRWRRATEPIANRAR